MSKIQNLRDYEMMEMCLKRYLEQLTVTCTQLDMLEGANTGNRKFHKAAMSLIVLALNADISGYFLQLKKFIHFAVKATDTAKARFEAEGEDYLVYCDEVLYSGAEALHQQRTEYEEILKFFSSTDFVDMVCKKGWYAYRKASTKHSQFFASEHV